MDQPNFSGLAEQVKANAKRKTVQQASADVLACIVERFNNAASLAEGAGASTLSLKQVRAEVAELRAASAALSQGLGQMPVGQ